MRKYKINPGDTFGDLTVIKNLGLDKKKRLLWECRCVCGRITKPTNDSLGRGITNGCNHCYKYKYVVPDSATRRFFRVYKRGARIRKISFDLTFEQFSILVSKPCYYCTTFPRLTSCSQLAKVKIPFNGIDRINSKFGYTETNMVPCCSICNNAKRTLSVEEFISWARKVVAHTQEIADGERD